ncbi:MAG: formylglycine-generating enzyme family protein [Gallionella sp.]|nr:formylglycine-generating enzyme family protein [Gallionella sp.]
MASQLQIRYVALCLVLLLGLARSAEADTQVTSNFRDCPDCPEMVILPLGSVEMGMNGVSKNEKPAHTVTIVQPFAIGKTEITQGQWRAIMGNNPSSFSICGDNCPVEQVSWSDAQEYIRLLNQKTGRQYRLPSEAEWEYACRAGENHQFCGGDNMDKVGWHSGNKTNPTHPVAGKQANAFGLFDMSGNVSEWVEDSYHDSYTAAPTDGSVWQGDGVQRVLRGGSWNFPPQLTRAAIRFADKPGNHVNSNGFRVAITPK